MLTREAILARKAELAREEVQVPEFGGSVFVRMMTGQERDRFEIATADAKRQNFRARIAAFTVCDEAGKLLFAEADVPLLGQLAGPGLARVADVALRLNKFTGDDVKELEKNSESNPSGDSPSA